MLQTRYRQKCELEKPFGAELALQSYARVTVLGMSNLVPENRCKLSLIGHETQQPSAHKDLSAR